MIIDFHTHIFPDRIAASAIDRLSHQAHIQAFSDATAAGLSRSLQEAGVDLAIVLPVATSPGQVEKINRLAAERNRSVSETGVFSFGCIHPDCEQYKEELVRVHELGLRGIKLHPVYQNTALDDLRFLRILDEAAALGLIVVSHAGYDIGYPGADLCSPAMFRHVIDEIGDFPFIAAHMGGWRYWEELPETLADTSVMLDTSFSLGEIHPLPDGYWDPASCKMLTGEAFVELVRLFGSERILFGTDSPWGGHRQCLDAIRALPLTDEEKTDILSRNAQRLLCLNHSRQELTAATI